jgi:hypothetical protein
MCIKSFVRKAFWNLSQYEKNVYESKNMERYCQKDNAKCCLYITLGSEIVWSSYSVMVVQSKRGIEILFFDFL